MSGELLDIKDFVSVLEVVLILVVSFIGASVHEYVFGTEQKKNFFKNPNILVTVVVDFVICYSINPFIIAFNPRFVLLPPLIIGLLGNELAKRMGTIKGSSTMLEYIFGFFDIKNKNESRDFQGAPDIDTDKEEKPSKKEEKDDSSTLAPPHNNPSTKHFIDNFSADVKEIYENNLRVDNEGVARPTSHYTSPFRRINLSQPENNIMMEIDVRSNNIIKKINYILNRYYTTNDVFEFYSNYSKIKPNITVLRSEISATQLLPITTALKAAEILKKEMEMDTIYSSIQTNISDIKLR